MFDHPGQSTPGRFGDGSEMWSRAPSEDLARKIERMGTLLSKKLGPEYLSTRQGPGGVKLTYIEGWRVMNLANEVFGFNGWSTAVKDLTIDFIDYNEDSQRWNAHVTALVRVTLPDGCYHEDVGCGKIDNCKSKTDALDKIKKEAVTDATKRALRSFGNLMGNCLYDKNFLADIAKVKAPGKPAFSFSDIHRPGQTYDPPVQAGQPPERKHVPIAGPSNPPAPARAQPQTVQQAQRQQPQPPQRQPVQPQQQAQRVGPPQQIGPPRPPNQLPLQQRAAPQQQQPSVVQNRNIQAPNIAHQPQHQGNQQESLAKEPDSEDMFDEDIQFDDEQFQGERVDPLYDDSGFEENQSLVQIQVKAEPTGIRPGPPGNNPNQRNFQGQGQGHQPQQQGRPSAQIPHQQQPQNQQAQRQNQPQNQGYQNLTNQNRPPLAMQRTNTAFQNAGMQEQSDGRSLPQEQSNDRFVAGQAMTSHQGGQAALSPEAAFDQAHRASQQRVRNSGQHQQSREAGAGNAGHHSSPTMSKALPSQFQGSQAGFAPPPAGMVIPQRVSFTTAKGVKRVYEETLDIDTSGNEQGAYQQAHGQTHAQALPQRAMSPSERAKHAEMLERNALIAKNRQAAMEKRQRNTGGRQSGGAPVSI